jgi:hypothetical protein
MAARASAAERFWSKVDKTGGPNACWEWTGYRNRDGYGTFPIRGVPRRVHRIAFRLHVGFLPKNVCVLHACDSPSCTNPRHLFAGTHQDNVADRHAKGRTPCGEHHYAAKLSQKQVDAIRQSAERGTVLAARYGVTKSTISCIRRGKIWTAGLGSEELAALRGRSQRKLTPDDVVAIRQSTESQSVLGRRYGVASHHISRIRTGARGKTLVKKPWIKPRLDWLDGAPNLINYEGAK